MVQAPDFGDWHDLTQLRPLDRAPVRRVLGEGEVGPGAVVVLEVPGKDVSQVALAQDEEWLRHSPRIEPIRRSAKGFCHGL